MSNKVPKDWRIYKPYGTPIDDTKLIPFKVPLRMEICRTVPEEEWFTPDHLMDAFPQLKCIIDLTNTDRYYNPQVFERRGVQHKKIYIEGHGQIPSTQKIKEFCDVTNNFLSLISNDSDALIGVHCTHGLHRTGYMICSYMVQHMKMNPNDAIFKFEKARGHAMERLNYVNTIKKMVSDFSTSDDRGGSSYNNNRWRLPSYDQQDSRSFVQTQNWSDNRSSNWRLPSYDQQDSRSFVQTQNRPNISHGESPRFNQWSRSSSYNQLDSRWFNQTQNQSNYPPSFNQSWSRSSLPLYQTENQSLARASSNPPPGGSYYSSSNQVADNNSRLSHSYYRQDRFSDFNGRPKR